MFIVMFLMWPEEEIPESILICYHLEQCFLTVGRNEGLNNIAKPIFDWNLDLQVKSP